MQIVKRSLLVALTALLVSACGGNGPQNIVSNNRPAAPSPVSNCQFIQHDLGQTKICGYPQRVVALDPNALDLLLSLGVQPAGYAEHRYALVGSPQSGKPMAEIKYFGDRITSNPIYVGIQQSPSLEAILRLKPDLILGQVYDESLYANLSQITPVLFPFKGEPSVNQWQKSLPTLGKVFDREQLARQVIEQHTQRVAAAKAELEPIARDSKVLLLGVSGLDSIEVFDDQTFAGALLTDLGFQLEIPKQKLPGALDVINLSLETLPQIDADMIIVMASGGRGVEEIKQEWGQNPILRSLPASKAEQVYFVDYQLWGRITGPIAAELIIDQVRKLPLQPN